jgi:hypothetical protein
MTFHSQHHSFDIHLASQYGIEEAIIIHHMQHWIRLNRRKGKNLKDGKCWMFETMEHIAFHFPYLNYEKVKYVIEGLVKNNILVKGNYNRVGFDKTNWYAFFDEKAFGVDIESSKILYDRENSPSIGKIPHPSGKIPGPIPDTIKKDAKEKINIKEGRKSAQPSADAKALTHKLISKMKEIKPNITLRSTEKWAIDLDLLIRKDGKNPKVISDVIDCLDERALIYVQSGDKFRKEFDSLELKNKMTLKKQRISDNRQFFLKCQSQYPKEFKNITFDILEVVDVVNNIKIPFDLGYKDFAEAIAKMIGGEIHES